MKPSTWKTGPLKTDKGASGFLALLFALLALHFLKLSPNLSLSPALPCPSLCFVQVEGDVSCPGVYPFCSQPHIREVIRMAGGMEKKGQVLEVLHPVNLFTGAKVSVICREGRCKAYLGDMEAYFRVSLHIPLSINRESEQALTAIPGISVRLAGAIVQERERRGGFKRVEEIATVRGMGPALYKKIKPFLIL
jgi:competence protein ComEA